MTKLDRFLEREREHVHAFLTLLVPDIQQDLKANPNDYIEPGTDEPTVDIRLCIDLGKESGEPEYWQIRTGDSSYDPYFSEYCSAGCIGLDTTAKDLTNELIDGIEED